MPSATRPGDRGAAQADRRWEDDTVQAVWASAGPEPALDELLHDPIVELLMQCDRISQQDILNAVQRARRHLNQPCPRTESVAS